MSISHLQLVNQKLAFANSIITSLAPVPGELIATQKLQQQALKDSAVFHLVTALHFYVRELAELHRVANVQAINSVYGLAAALSEIDKASSEVSELVELEQTTDTWLNQLTCYYAQLFHSPEKPKEKKAFGQESASSLIELTEVDGPPALKLTSELLMAWLASFRSLIDRQRGTSAEY